MAEVHRYIVQNGLFSLDTALCSFGKNYSAKSSRMSLVDVATPFSCTISSGKFERGALKTFSVLRTDDGLDFRIPTNVLRLAFLRFQRFRLVLVVGFLLDRF